jgi:hypothetical protein
LVSRLCFIVRTQVAFDAQSAERLPQPSTRLLTESYLSNR